VIRSVQRCRKDAAAIHVGRLVRLGRPHQRLEPHPGAHVVRLQDRLERHPLAGAAGGGGAHLGQRRAVGYLAEAAGTARTAAGCPG